MNNICSEQRRDFVMLKFLKKVDPAWIILVVVSIIGLSIYWCYFLEPRMFRRTFCPLIFAEETGEPVLVEYNDVIMELDHLDANVVGYFMMWDVKLPIVITDKENKQHMTIHYQELTVEDRAELFVKRFQALLDSDLPLHKTGLAHMTDSLMANATWEDHIKTVDLIPDEVYKKLFNQAREKGLGIELNFRVKQYTEEEMERILRPYRIAKKCGCKFYLGSDAHRPVAFEGIRENFEKIVDMLVLEETDKFHICTQK